jgi:hypothetical protein
MMYFLSIEGTPLETGIVKRNQVGTPFSQSLVMWIHVSYDLF